VWLPERHFHEFGGLFPNPAVVAAAVAQVTSRIQLRGGSIVSPLHDPLRIAEEWAVVDNLSGGRVGMSFGSGWNADDFVFYPDRYDGRRNIMYKQIETICSLWGGGSVRRKNGKGKDVHIRVFPRPIQKTPQIWITSGGSTETFIGAGKIGAHLLTSMENQTVDELASKIKCYRSSLRDRGFDPQGHKVALMLHTYLGRTLEEAKSQARPAMRKYLEAAVSLELKASHAGGAVSAGPLQELDAISKADMEDLTEIAFERYFSSASLMGTVEDRVELMQKLEQSGVDEIACLIDFLDSPKLILDGLGYLDTLRRALY
jgi:natural product biosynthesis luciferase-like monooxygenase protein